VELQTIAPGRPNVIARLVPRGRVRHRVLLVPHLDTVPATNPDQYVPRTENGRLYGRGSCDTKGSVAAMLSALSALTGPRRRPESTEIVFAGVVDEEDIQAGSRALVQTGIKADLAIVGEPTRLQVVTANKGNLWLRFETRGRSAHGSRPELGKNAVHVMARIVDVLETDYARTLRRRKHRLLGHPTISVGTISGGTQANIVPDRCELTADRRTLPGETEAEVLREVKGLLRRKGLKALLSNAKNADCPPLETDARLPFVRAFMKIAGQSRPLGVHYFCDASVLSKGGIPSVVFGPGDIAQAHTPDEWISLHSLDRAVAMLRQYLESLS
jgi:acetylornithine deacetylase/succinyl-diaminopimelate desuccinylase-like protein